VKPQSARKGLAWLLASVAGVLVLMWFMFLVRVPEAPVLTQEPRPPTVGLVNPVVITETMLQDPTPLFLPTEFNSSRIDYVPREPSGAFAGFPPKMTFSDVELELHLPPPVEVPTTPADALAGDPPGAPFIGFDRPDPVVELLSPRAAYVEIVDAGTGRSVFGTPVTDARPPASSIPWQPMEFMAAVDSSGLVGPVVPTTRSGVGDVDAYFGRYLAETLRVGQRLAPGFYRIIVGP
jgi:hypothetical protein